jgi:hypothetical protein
MPGKRVQFDPETWHALDQLAKDRMQDFQELADDRNTAAPLTSRRRCGRAWRAWISGRPRPRSSVAADGRPPARQRVISDGGSHTRSRHQGRRPKLKADRAARGEAEAVADR